MPERPDVMPEREPGFFVMRDPAGAERLYWRPDTPELAVLLSSLTDDDEGRAIERAFLSCGLDGAVMPCACTEHLHQDAYGTCTCGHSCVWHFEDGARAPCRGLLMSSATA